MIQFKANDTQIDRPIFEINSVIEDMINESEEYQIKIEDGDACHQHDGTTNTSSR